MTPERLAELETKAKHPEWRFAAPKATILDLLAHIRDLEAQAREARGLAEKAYKQAEMYFVREWRSSGALTAACEELQGQGYGGDVDDIEAEMLACIAPPIWPKRLIEIRDALATATPPSPEVGA